MLESRLTGGVSIDFLEEMVNQQVYVAFTFSQRRDIQHGDSNAMEQVFAKAAFDNVLQEIPVGGGNDPEVDLTGFG